MKKIYITEEERNLIASTPPKECWICDKLINNIYYNVRGYYLKKEEFVDHGIEMHLRQIIHREIIFK